MRLFVAVDLDPARHEAVARAAAGLRRALDSEGWGRALRWVAPGHLHLTIRFLGEMEEAAGARVGEALAAPLDVAPFDVVFEGAGVFPPRGAPRVVWIGLASGVDGLARVLDAVESRLQPLGVAPDTRPLSPHLTIARLRDRARGGRPDAPRPADAQRRRLAAALDAVRVATGAQPVRSITLYQSRLTPAGPEYSPLVSTPLAGV